MKLLTYEDAGGSARLGLVHESYVYDVAQTCGYLGNNADAPNPAGMHDVLDLDASGFRQTSTIHDTLRSSDHDRTEFLRRGLCRPLEATRVLLPFTPRAVICTGNNYRDHVEEKEVKDIKDQKGDDIEFFQKLPECIVGPYAPVTYSAELTGKLDYEVELAVIIGREAWKTSPEDAAECIFGYAVLNDLSARDRQLSEQGCPKLGLSKNFEGCGAFGPCIVTADELSPPIRLELTTRVNDEIRQHSNTKHMINGPALLISHFSRFFKLKPGYVLATGTVGGTAWSTDAELGGIPYERGDIVRGGYLKPGDTVSCAIEGIGELRNLIVE